MYSAYLEKLEKLKNINLKVIAETARLCLPKYNQATPWTAFNLERGVAIYNNENQLDAYLAAYAVMHLQKLNILFKNLPYNVLNQKFNIVDWGCGQGIATLTLLEFMKYYNISFDNIEQIILIEPSEVALKRAILHIKYFYPNANIKRYNTVFNSFEKENLSIENNNTVLHLFSNVLDLKHIDLKRLYKIISFLKNHSYVLMTSPSYVRARSQLDNFISLFNDKKLLFEYDKRGKSELIQNDYTCYCKIIELGYKENNFPIEIYDDNFVKNEIICNIYNHFEKITYDNNYFKAPFLHGFTVDLMIIGRKIGAILFNISFAKNEQEIDQAIHEINEAKSVLFELHPKLFRDNLKDSRNYKKITSCIYFVNFSQNELEKKESYVKLIGNSSLNEALCRKIYEKNKSNQQSFTNSKEIYDYFIKVLLANYHLKEEGKEYILSNPQKLLSKSRVGRQKIKGVAGSGKTLVLLFRAIDAYKRTGSPVLILTYNLTLCNYLWEKLDSIPEDFDKNFIFITSFHQFIKAAYSKISIFDFAQPHKRSHFFNADSQDQKTLIDNKLLIKYSHKFQKFRSVFIDEGQDFEEDWFRIIYENFTLPNCEFVIFADEKQNIYSRELDNDKMPRTPIPGAWNRSLSMMYRNINNLNRLLQELQVSFLLQSYNYDKIDTYQYSLLDSIKDNQLKLYYSSYEQIDYNELLEFIFEMLERKGLNYSECVILSPIKEPLIELNEILNEDYDIATNITFETKEEAQMILHNISSNAMSFDDLSIDEKKTYHLQCHAVNRHKKINFYLSNNKFSLSTIHSFKGWEARAVFLLLYTSSNQEKVRPIKPELLYTGVSRSKEFCFIINISNNKYDEFFFECDQVEYLNY